ncbi:hypothetical protein ACLK1S_06515 [Escherichia coli]
MASFTLTTHHQTPAFGNRVIAHRAFNYLTIIANTVVYAVTGVSWQFFISAPVKSTTKAMVPWLANQVQAASHPR